MDRSEETRDLFATLFLAMRYEVKTMTTGTEALAWTSVFRPRAVFPAIRLPYQSGFDQYLVKPVKLDVILASLNLLHRSDRTTTAH